MDSPAGNVQKCVLQSRNYKYRDIALPNKTPVIIGRGPKTKIKERRCSKKQVEITPDYDRRKVSVLQLGPNPSEVNGKLLRVQEEIDVYEGSNINLLKNDLLYTVVFVSGEQNQGSNSSSSHLGMSLNSDSHSDKSNSPSKISLKKTLNDYMSSSHSHKKSKRSKRDLFEDEVTNKKVKKVDDCMDENDDVYVEEVTAKLAAMKNSLAKEQNSVDCSSSALSQKSSRENFYGKPVQSVKEDRWEEHDHSRLLEFVSVGLEARSKIAAFDLDHTIICTKSGKVFPTNMDDWQIMYAEIPGKLKKLHQEGYKIVFLTNQKGISRGKTSASDFKRKAKAIVRKLGIPIQVFVSTGSGRYRKPNTGMWDYLVRRGNQGITLDHNKCFYVGDAAGRLENWAPKKKKDFSCADRLFALNLNLSFYTPEEFFLGYNKVNFRMPVFDPRTLGNEPLAVRYKPTPNKNIAVNDDNLASASPEVIICVGFPASGKSHFVETYLVPRGYVHVNRDTLGTWQKCVAECATALSKGKSVVIDNTNPDLESRSRYTECAKKCKVPCRCFLFNCSLEQAKHNNVFRELSDPDKKHVGVNDMVLNSYKSKYKEPDLEEGFNEILKINFVPKFKSSNDELLFRKFLIEK